MWAGCAVHPYSLPCDAGLDRGWAWLKSQLQGTVERVLKMLDDRACPRGAERDRHHVDPHLTVLQPVAADVGGSQFGDPPLLLQADGLRRMPVGGVGPRPHLDEYHRAAVEGDEIDVSAEHPLPPADNPVAQAPEKLLSLGLAT